MFMFYTIFNWVQEIIFFFKCFCGPNFRKVVASSFTKFTGNIRLVIFFYKLNRCLNRITAPPSSQILNNHSWSVYLRKMYSRSCPLLAYFCTSTFFVKKNLHPNRAFCVNGIFVILLLYFMIFKNLYGPILRHTRYKTSV